MEVDSYRYVILQTFGGLVMFYNGHEVPVTNQ